jgi:hypothetical protein
LLDSNKAIQARQKGFTFVGLAATPHPQSVAVDPPAPAADADVDAGAPKILVNADGQAVQVQDPGTPKKLYADVAAQGAPTAGTDVPKKFYGQGAEVVVGPVAVRAEPAIKISDKAVAKDQAPVTEDGTGEAKLYDKVAQADTDQPQGDAPSDDGGKLFERAQQVASDLHGNKKTVVVEVAAYANTAAITTGDAAAAAATTVVTA